MKDKVQDPSSGIMSDCKNMDNCDKLILAEIVGEAACCLCTEFA